jgi:hypothetical protein
MTSAQIVTLVIAILGVLHGPLVTNLLSRGKGQRKP